jgi:hypothetical protein
MEQLLGSTPEALKFSLETPSGLRVLGNRGMAYAYKFTGGLRII